MNSFKDKINQVGIMAKEASKSLAKVSTNQKNKALLAMADHILNDKELILDANKIDIEQAKS
jgi:glutamate-5-semialdehyde dehydrogenase